MNRNELTEATAKMANISKKDAGLAIETAIDVVKQALAAGDSVTLVGFGTFKAVRRAERPGRNPRTGESMKIAARNGVKFTAGKELQASVNP